MPLCGATTCEKDSSPSSIFHQSPQHGWQYGGRIPSWEGQGPSGPGVGCGVANRPTPSLCDRVKSSQDFTFAPPLPGGDFLSRTLNRPRLGRGFA